MYKGHDLVTLMDKKWLLDVTEYKVYKVTRNHKGNVTGIQHALTLYETEYGLGTELKMGVPFGVIRMAKEYIAKYNRERGNTGYDLWRSNTGEELLHMQVN